MEDGVRNLEEGRKMPTRRKNSLKEEELFEDIFWGEHLERNEGRLLKRWRCGRDGDYPKKEAGRNRK